MSQAASVKSANPPVKIARWIILGLVIFLFFVMSRIPAEWGAWLMTRQPGLALSGIKGTLWKGQANLASLTLEGKSITLGKLQWDLQMSSLLKLNPCVKLSITGQAQSFNGFVCSSLGGVIRVQDADVNLPASLVQSRIPFPATGQISAHITTLELRGNVLLDLAGNLSWSNAQVQNLVAWIPLGSFAAEFTDNDNNGIKAKIFDLESDLDVEVNLELRAPAGGTASGQLKIPQTFIDQYRIADFLAFIGPQAGQENGKALYQLQQEF
jgi:general secretion pathway protein N